MLILTSILAGLLGAVPAPSPAAVPPNCHAARTFTGTICSPGDARKHPALLMLGGSEGGDSLAKFAAKEAARGYVAASVAYFGGAGLPSSLEQVPLETVGGALDEISKRADVDSKQIGIFGISKGGEFALLAASTYPQIHAVIADVPSPFGWQGIPNEQSSNVYSSWTFHGKPLPFVPFGPAMSDAFAIAFGEGKPLDLRPGYDGAMQNKASVDAAFFHLERIHGPVLFVAAGDDRIWNSLEQSRLGLAYLKVHHHPYADALLAYPKAGHLFILASADRPLVSIPFVASLTLLLGGTAQANVAAGADARPKIDAFFDRALKR